ncbi:hypothetical protein ACLHDD_01225 [Pantoea sp. NSTU24]|uniref:hypothetical protein n=1 Tax=Pantoea sp. NSTU24 TaxID=3391144 RepID=UPI003CFFB96B
MLHYAGDFIRKPSGLAYQQLTAGRVFPDWATQGDVGIAAEILRLKSIVGQRLSGVICHPDLPARIEKNQKTRSHQDQRDDWSMLTGLNPVLFNKAGERIILFGS